MQAYPCPGCNSVSPAQEDHACQYEPQFHAKLPLLPASGRRMGRLLARGKERICHSPRLMLPDASELHRLLHDSVWGESPAQQYDPPLTSSCACWQQAEQTGEGVWLPGAVSQAPAAPAAV